MSNTVLKIFAGETKTEYEFIDFHNVPEDLWHEVFDGAAGSLSITENVEVWFNIAPDTDNLPPTLGVYGSWGSFIHSGNLYFADKSGNGLSQDQIDQIKNIIGRKVIRRANRLIPCLLTEVSTGTFFFYRLVRNMLQHLLSNKYLPGFCLHLFGKMALDAYL